MGPCAAIYLSVDSFRSCAPVIMLLAPTMALTKRGSIHGLFIRRLLSSVHIHFLFSYSCVNCYLPGEVDKRKTESFFPTFLYYIIKNVDRSLHEWYTKTDSRHKLPLFSNFNPTKFNNLWRVLVFVLLCHVTAYYTVCLNKRSVVNFMQ